MQLEWPMLNPLGVPREFKSETLVCIYLLAKILRNDSITYVECKTENSFQKGDL